MCAQSTCAYMHACDRHQRSSSLPPRLQGLATQMFTEVGNYHLAFEEPAQTLHQRMVTAACAISVDYDYYSRRVGGGGLLWAPWVFGGGSSDD